MSGDVRMGVYLSPLPHGQGSPRSAYLGVAQGGILHSLRDALAEPPRNGHENAGSLRIRGRMADAPRRGHHGGVQVHVLAASCRSALPSGSGAPHSYAFGLRGAIHDDSIPLQ